ncbi:MAG: FtsH protease activity modulator HflK [Chromatiaceae bacterium]|nr:FtsH protease activity modulator HflK [Gammaproteobacteria bacterium]MCP5427922.1 FtsH protease activity modulator HflK [Chromatiaceae bacterium]MCB1872588.1 FtsH protease activity modulator HflK [Gammaproteobacteria bacterium]MCB1880839.1 FtsH protease activity modulator HflK [Gammaproteobacteria bacterium]MCB1904157.1 FtsH protease activity modulator HflK [Gammaproteobacteria bacterium]
MAWNEPGGDNKDPWSGKGSDQGPPDLDEVVKKMQEKLGGLFGGRKGPRSVGPGGSIPSPGPAGMRGIAIVVGVVLILLLGIKSFYTVEPAERGVVMRFGAFSSITGPGPHLLVPFIDQVMKVNVDQITSFSHKAQMLTKDENIVDIELTVQSRIQDAADYLFQDQNPEKTLRDATETAVRETIGKSKLDFILTEGRGSIADSIKTRAQELINLYRSGLEVTSVNTQPAKPPEAVKNAFDDAIKAREDKARLENQAQAYANEVVPKARGAGARRVEAAKAYRDKVIAESEGETSRFLAVLTEFEKAPEVTRQRLYLDAVEEVLGRTNKVIMDVKEGNSLMYLPIDKLIEGTQNPRRALLPEDADQIESPLQQSRREDNSRQDSSRGRSVR